MFCNQIFSILKKKIEPVTETPVVEEVIEGTAPEETLEEQTEPEGIPVEPATVSEEGDTAAEPEATVTEEESPTYVVANVIVCESYEIASRIARCEFGETALAIDTTLYPVAIGDTYRAGVFYDALGNVIERNLTEQEQIETLQRANAEQAAVIADLNQQLLMVQLAAAELYEQSRAAETTEEPVETTEPEAAESEGE